MLYERILDLAPSMVLERRLGERLAARFVIGLLLAVPFCAIASLTLVSGLLYALASRTCEAGLHVGVRIREGLRLVPS